MTKISEASIRQIPVLVIGYNRVDLLQGLLKSLQRFKLANIYIYLDGPKINSQGDQLLVERCRNLVIAFKKTNNIRFKFNENNMGCKSTVTMAIDWVFEEEDRVVVVEDDLELSKHFFKFMLSNLKKYENQKNILTIGAHSKISKNFLDKIEYRKNTYLSIYPDVWGWATWKDRWNKYNSEVFRQEGVNVGKVIKSIRFSPLRTAYFLYNFYAEKYKCIDTWDFQLTHFSLTNGMFNVICSENLVCNLGFREDSTHTKISINKKETIGNWEDRNDTYPLEYIRRIDVQISRLFLDNFFRSAIKKIYYKIRKFIESRIRE